MECSGLKNTSKESVPGLLSLSLQLWIRPCQESFSGKTFSFSFAGSVEVLLPENTTTLVLRKALSEKDHHFNTSDIFDLWKPKIIAGWGKLIWVTGARPRQKMRWVRQPLSRVFPVLLGCSSPNPGDLTNGCEGWNYQHSSVPEVEPSALMKPLLFTG